MTRAADKPRLDPEFLREIHAVKGHHYLRLFSFALLYILSAVAVYQIHLHYGGPWWLYLASIPLYILAGASLHGISLFTHEGVHQTLSTSAAWNRALSVLCALPVGQNFAAYKVLHLKHHDHLGDEGDPDHYDNYTEWTWLVFIMHWLRLIIGYPVYITMIPIMGFRQGNTSDRIWISIEVLLLFALVGAVILSPLPWSFLLHGWLIPMVFINTMVNIRGMSQHTLLEHETDTVKGTRTITTNPVTRFFMCNENYHLEHHLYPGVPWYNLGRLHSELREELKERGAPFINSYFQFVWEFVVASIRRSPAGTVFWGDKAVEK